MEIIKCRRQELNLTIQQVSALTGIPRSTLWNIEHGRCLAEPVGAQKLRKLLMLPGLPDSSQVLQPRSTLRRPFDRARNNRVFWSRMEKVCAHQLRQLRPPPQVLDWMKECLPSDSPDECLALCDLASNGAIGQFSNPHVWGYRQLCLLDRDGQALGERNLPGLRWSVNGQEVLIWPQITILHPKGTFRVDMLIYVAGQWLMVEIDGNTHNPHYDQFRDDLMPRRPLHISNNDVRKLRFATILSQEIVALRCAA